ncbi:intermembrane transport protein PqiB [Marinomonas ostreistagni]|uniref:intermembrane transport protein PqiB n=1 Tax=Marinomonas ostreistagni TaxID=359209 RepID=UPI001950ED64|nr:intermembrane transport protein PqiB [Marinomonas ostreistagni]MBM6551577.1 intermembrane transport protein PqiB [Marinomonas ostreistagni]
MSSTKDHQANKGAVAVVKSTRNISKIWLIPLVTLILGAWFIFQDIKGQGVSIEIEFETAAGLEAGKTQLKIRDVVIGRVDDIRLSDDSSSVLVTANLDSDAEKYLRTDTRFWVVSPQVSLAGISGLQTLVSGSYIDMSPGVEGEPARQFKGLSDPPVTPIGTPGLRVYLQSEQSFTAKVGDPVIYRGLSVGRIETVEYDLKSRRAEYSAFIEAPFDQLVTSNTRFWNSSGIELELGVEGLGVTTSSLESLLVGGITFDEPNEMPPVEPLSEDRVFHIYPTKKSAVAHRYEQTVYYVILVESSVRGLVEGAPVEYRGLKIGQVEEVNLKLESDDREIQADAYKIPVLISIQPGRANLTDDEQGKQRIAQQLEAWVARGLRASLKTGNLLTGSVFVDLQHYDDVESARLGEVAGYTVIPTVPGQIMQLAEQINTTLEKVNDLPINGVAQDLRTLLQDLASSAQAFNDTSNSLTTKLDQLDMRGLNDTLASLNTLLTNLSEDEQGMSSVNETMTEIQEAIRELKPLLQKMNSAPNSLIFKSQVAPDIEPQGVKR